MRARAQASANASNARGVIIASINRVLENRGRRDFLRKLRAAIVADLIGKKSHERQATANRAA